MKNQISFYLHSSRFRLLLLIYLFVTGVSLLTRVVLLIYSSHEIDCTVGNVIGIFFIGFLYDIISAGYFTIPIVLYLWFMPEKFFKHKIHYIVLYLLFVVSCIVLLVNAAAEFFFWEEFSSRFNFIAVDYLVYTTEVLGNINQSYPIEWIITVIALISVLATFVLRKFLVIDPNDKSIRLKQRTTPAALVLTFPVFCFFFIDNTLHFFSNNAYANELAGNGMYELFAAYRNNELDFVKFYPHITDREAVVNVKKLIGGSAEKKMDDYSLVHEVPSSGEEKKMNVVLISVESLSAEYMGLFGNDQGLTPFLDSLSQHSLTFTNVYATGTRTVRGLEALSLSVPPTPGQSIVRRPNNEGLFTLATVFHQKGYACKYIYGGYGYFDNMSYYFGNNGYEVIDRSALDDDEIDYENIWGIADENLFTLSLREIDQTVDSGKQVFAHIMTTSNHRPFTYPAGRIDIPSHTSRAGAVKYTDYALCKFFHEARKKKWFENTIFVVTADHCASSAGKTELPIKKYQIPLLIFSPGKILPQHEDRLMSQIDIAPTLLGLLNFSYTSKFYGYDIFKLKKGNERAFISTYQALGLLEGDTM
ncbi:MAG TPA: LTA synthase family protein, partial [Cyclobacteriaceae bacterium]|nr:LTA synthase family protein [Cyclobacteriaceae bacterium]